jgi:suppressor of ftsI/bilirubin oxidase
MAPRRRTVLSAALGAAGLGALGGWARLARAQRERADAAAEQAARESICRVVPGFDQALHVPGGGGLLGLLAPRGPLVLTAAATRLPVNGRPVDGLAFAARSGGADFLDPTLWLRRGQQVRIDFENALDEPTIVHWHGLSVDTANDGSGLVLAAPGKGYRYDFRVADRAALYWYHPHPHGTTAAQVARGLFGLILVDDDEELAFRAARGLVPGVTDVPLVLTDARADAPLHHDVSQNRLVGIYGGEALVNFSLRPVLEVRRTLYRFRVFNAANARNFRIAFCDAGGRRAPFTLIGVDGGRLDRTAECRELFLSPAERIDVLLDCARLDPGASLFLWSLPFDPMVDFDGASAPSAPPAGVASAGAPPAGVPVAAAIDGAGMPLLRLVASGSGGTVAQPAPASVAPASVAPASVAPASGAFASSASTPFAEAPVRSFRLGFAKARWRINDRVYESGAFPIEVKRGSREVWLVRNYHTSMPHAMHLHAFHFHVLERQTSPDAIAAIAGPDGLLPTDRGPKDTVLIWPGETVKVGIDFSHPFPGEQVYLFHCHNLEHEDHGMMVNVRVV